MGEIQEIRLDDTVTCNMFLRQLKRGKTRGLGCFELLRMHFIGMQDGRRGLPVYDDEHGWTSPAIQKERNAYEEYCCRVWGETQIRTAALYEQARTHMDEIRKEGARLERLKEEPPSPGYAIERRTGEEGLSDEVVKLRRQREAARAAAPYFVRYQQYEETIMQHASELSAIKNRLAEVANDTRFACDRVRDHTRQRMDVYVDRAMRTHPAGNEIRVERLPETASEPEIRYMEIHRDLDKTILEILDYAKELLPQNAEKGERA